MFAQDPLRERVQRADRRAVQIVQATAQDLDVPLGGSTARRDEIPPQTLAQFGGGLLCEGDGGDVGQCHAAAHQCHDPRHQRRRLTGSRAGLQEEVAGQILGRGLARAVVAVAAITDARSRTGVVARMHGPAHVRSSESCST